MLGWLFGLFSQPSKPVETYDEALTIGQTAIRKIIPNYDTSNQEISLSYDSQKKVWCFRYFTKHDPGEYIFGGIGPGVEIRKSDGKITFLKGQK